ATRVLDEAGLCYEDIGCVIPHQANLRIIEAIAERMGLPMEKFYVNLDRFGNTSAAAVAIALDEAHRSGRFKIGDYILLVVFGGGLTWASSVIQWLAPERFEFCVLRKTTGNRMMAKFPRKTQNPKLKTQN